MYPESCRFRQRGAGLPVALFIITVLALLVAGMAQLQESSGQAVSLQIQSQRAFYAAESGAQVAVARVLDAGSCSALGGPIIYGEPGLRGCRAELACSSILLDIEASPAEETVFDLTSQGQCGTGPDRAERTVEVRVR